MPRTRTTTSTGVNIAELQRRDALLSARTGLAPSLLAQAAGRELRGAPSPRVARITVSGMLRGKADLARLGTLRGWVRMYGRDLDVAARLVDLSTLENHRAVAEILRERFSSLDETEAHALAVEILRAI